ncbi:MAG: signal peptidase I [Dehalococcoidia bacterium]
MNWRRPPSVRTRVVALAAAAAACLALPAWRLGRGLQRVEVAGDSMTPELQPGDFLLLRRGAPDRERAYGRIVITEDPRPEGAGRLLLKRIVGLPGEALRVGGGVQVNGRRLIEPYAHGADPAEQHRGVQRLAEDTYFLLGDHRAASTDSRDFGPVSRERITATAVLRYWPPGRIGRLEPPLRRFLGPAEPPEGAHPGHHEHTGHAHGAPLPDAGSS